MPTNYHNRYRRSGFTLIELLIVVVIIGLLTSIATASYLRAQQNARDNARKTDLQSIAAAVETYYAANKKFPGKTDLKTATASSSNPSIPSGYNDSAKGCEFFESNVAQKPAVYFYVKGVDCSTVSPANAAAAGGFTKADYLPGGSWIPGLGAYLNISATEKRYAGQTTAGFADMLRNNAVRTYAYRHLDGGFMVYGRLEGTLDGDDNFIGDPQAISDQPMLTGNVAIPVSASSENLYIIRQ